MSPETDAKPKRYLDWLALRDGYTDFILSRQAALCSPETLSFYNYTAGAFLTWIESQGVTAPSEISARHVREYLARLVGEGKSDRSVHDHARAIKTLLRFWHAEGYLPAPIDFKLPKLEQRRLPVLSAEQLRQLLATDLNLRDRALILFIADTGLRRAEVCALDWGDIDMASGAVRVRRGKGGKARTAVVGALARRALLAYRRTLGSPDDQDPLFVSKSRARLSRAYLGLIFSRLSARTGIHVTAHALRRTFVILSLRGGMDVLHLQALLGHASLEMVQHYAQLVDDDLLEAHRVHSPIDNLGRLSEFKPVQSHGTRLKGDAS